MNDNGLHLKIISAIKTIYDGSISSINLPGVLGSFSIYPDHAPLISSLQKGVMIYHIDGKEYSMDIEGGFVEVKQGEVIVCIA